MSPSPTLGQRQVHLDFHTPGGIRGVGNDFDPTAFAKTISDSHIDSVTVFSRCHHGYIYHPTSIGTMHPGLSFDLLDAQIRALHSVNVRAPVYITVGWDELTADAAEVQVLQQPSHNDRYVVHIVHAVPQRRGEDIDIVEDVLPLHHCRVGVRAGRQVEAVMLAPGEQLLSHDTEKGVTKE